MIAASARRLDGARHRLTAWRELTQLRTRLPALLVGTPAEDRLDDTHNAVWTRSGVAVFLLAPTADTPAVVVKATRHPGAAASLERQHATLTLLRGIEALGAWRVLLPQPLAQRDADELRVVVESALTGTQALDARHGATPEQLLSAISPLHRHTGGSVIVGELQFTRWVAEPLERLAALDGFGAAQRMTLTRLSARLAGELIGSERRTGWVHGDFWLANALVDADGTVTGIVDWDRAAPDELALHDVLHALLYTRKLHLGQPLGAVVAQQLREPVWSQEERLAITAVSDDPAALTSPTAVTLYWLRHVAENLRRDPVYATNQGWLRGNVLPVLDVLRGGA